MPVLKGDTANEGAPIITVARAFCFSDEPEPEPPRQIAPPAPSLGLGFLLTTSGALAPETGDAAGDADFLGSDGELAAAIAAAQAWQIDCPVDELEDVTRRLRALRRRAAELAAEADFLANGVVREGEFIRHSRNRAGEVMPADKYRELSEGEAERATQTVNLALSLTSAGVEAFDRKGPRWSIVDPDPEHETRKDLPRVRRQNVFPTVAAGRRAPMLKHLEAHATRHPELEMVTLTNGPVFIVWAHRPGAFRGEIGAFHGRISRLNDSSLFRLCGYGFDFRATEFGTVRDLGDICPFPREEGTENGVPAFSVHIHAHLLGRFDRPVSPLRRRRFMRLFWRYWRAHWDMGHRLDKVREACKYPTKPGDLDALRPTQLAQYSAETKGMKIVQPLGELAEARRGRREWALTGRRWRNGDGKLELRFRPCWNAKGPRDLRAASRRAVERERERRAGLFRYLVSAGLGNAGAEIRLARRTVANARRLGVSIGAFLVAWVVFGQMGRDWLAEPCLALAVALADETHVYRLATAAEAWGVFPQTLDEAAAKAISRFETPLCWPETPAERRLKAKQKAKANRPPRKELRNRIIARLPAATYFDPIHRPSLLVANFDGNYAALRALPFVAQYLAAVSPQIRAAEGKVRAEAEAAAAADVSGLIQSSHLTHNSDGVFASESEARA